MWHEGYRVVCRRHPDLVAVYESPGGELGLLLDDTLLPPSLARHRWRWLAQTRHAGRRIVADLRRAGFQGDVYVVQCLCLSELADVVRCWSCRYDRDAGSSAAVPRRRFLRPSRILTGLVASAQTDWKRVEEAFGQTGALQADGVFRVALQRHDLGVSVGPVRLEPSFALASYTVFRPIAPATTAAGMPGHVAPDDDEICSATTMHFSAHGDAAELAAALRAALGAVCMRDIKGPRRIFKIAHVGPEIPPITGMATALKLSPAKSGNVAITGDFVPLGSEARRVARRLREHGIDVTISRSSE